MELWTMWTNILESALGFFTTYFGFSDAVAIILLTLLARTLMMPFSLTSAYRMQKNKYAIDRIKPALEELRKKYKDNPNKLANRTMQLYRDNGIKFMDKISVLNIGFQGMFGIGTYQILRRMVFRTRFWWISDLAKPDFLLTVLVGALMLLGMSLMPDANHNASMVFMLAVPVVISIIAIAALPSAIGIYWATSNAVTVVQTLVLRGLLTGARIAQNTSKKV
jgi:YidC/Oxa1 family membrane protein insertase